MSYDTVRADPCRTPPASFRILFVLEYFPPHIGGVETLFDQLARALVQAGHRVTVITLRVPGAKAREHYHGVEVIRVPAPRRARRTFFTFLAIPLVVHHAFLADIVHAATPSAALSTWIGASIARKPAVHTVHEVFADLLAMLPGLHPLQARAFSAYEKFVLRLPFAHYVCDSHFTRERLSRLVTVPAERSTVVYPVVDYTFWERARHRPRNLKTELGLDESTFLYLYFGRPGHLKGVEYLIDAAVRVRRDLPSSRLLLLLDDDPPDHYRRLRQRIYRSGLADYAIVRDPVPRAELPGYLLAADCIVIPSVSEGFGYAAIEAAALGCTVIATSGHAVEEVLARHAAFVSPRDVAALAETIVAVARNPLPFSAPPPRFTCAAHVAAMEALYMRLTRCRTQTKATHCDGRPV